MKPAISVAVPKSTAGRYKQCKQRSQKKLLMHRNTSISIANDLLAFLSRTAPADLGAPVNMFDNRLSSIPSEPFEMIGDLLDRPHYAFV